MRFKLCESDFGWAYILHPVASTLEIKSLGYKNRAEFVKDNEVLVQTDWDYPNTAAMFGWTPCKKCGDTDGVTVREIEVIGRGWYGQKMAYSYPLTTHDVEQIGELTRESVSDWLDSNSGDFQSIEDFHADIAEFDSPWVKDESEFEYSDMMYGMGKTNIDPKNGIRFGVIALTSVSGYALDDLVYDYPFNCPDCGNNILVKSKSARYDYYCQSCRTWHMEEDCYGEESTGFHYDGDGYKLIDCLDFNIMVIESLYYTKAEYCSPCVPGAGNLDSTSDDGVKTYCLGPDWFDGDNKIPYHVYLVKDNSAIEVREEEETFQIGKKFIPKTNLDCMFVNGSED